MTDNTDKDVVEIEAEPVEAPKPEPTAPEDKPKGGGFVWLLAFVLAVGIGGYAAWPYLGDDVHNAASPYIKQVRSSFGMERRPTQPTMPPKVQAEPAPKVIAEEPPMPASSPVSQVAEVAQLEPVMAPAPIAEPESIYVSEPETLPPAPQPIVDTSGLENRLAQLEAQTQTTGADIAPLVRSLTDRMDILERQMMNVPAPSGDGQALSREATGHISALIADLRAEVTTLKTRIAAMEATPKGMIDPSASAQALVLSVTQLSTAVNDAGPFAANLDALERIGAADPVIATATSRLRMFADTGVPTQSALIKNFKPMSIAVMQAHKAQAREGWWDEVTGTVSGLVTIRQTDPARIDDPVERALAVAELALAKRDVQTAVAALAQLQGDEAVAAGDWMRAAHARVEAADALNILHNHAVAALATTGAQ
ncbi:MAG: mitofilin family membrane protein [Magnetovibrio sp.]|nr:mitofilin family membrane protein [Magnetovibrio sp.]